MKQALAVRFISESYAQPRSIKCFDKRMVRHFQMIMLPVNFVYQNHSWDQTYQDVYITEFDSQPTEYIKYFDKKMIDGHYEMIMLVSKLFVPDSLTEPGSSNMYCHSKGQQMYHIWSCVIKKNLSSGFLTRSDTNQTVQPQKLARGLKFWI